MTCCFSHVIVMLEENEAGEAGREDIACAGRIPRGRGLIPSSGGFPGWFQASGWSGRMEFRQPCEVNGFTFKRHAVGHLLGNGLPAQLLLRAG